MFKLIVLGVLGFLFYRLINPVKSKKIDPTKNSDDAIMDYTEYEEIE